MARRLILLEDSSKVELGGGQRISLAVLDTIIESGTEVLVFDHSADSRFGKAAESLGAKVIGYGRAIKSVEVSKESSQNRMLPLIYEFADSLLISLRLFKSLKDEDFDYLYSTTKKMLFVASIIRLFYGSTYNHIYHFHSYVKSSKILKLMSFLMKSQSIEVIVPSHFMKLELERYDIPSVIVRNFTAELSSDARPKLEGRSIDVAFVGGDLIWKGSEKFSGLVDLMVKRRPDQKYMFSATGLSRPLSFKPPIESSAVSNLMDFLCGVKLVVFPSQSPESFCISAAEARSCGCLIVYNPIGALPEVLSGYERAICVQSDSADAYATEVINALDRLSLYDSYEANCEVAKYKDFRSDIKATFGY